MQLKVFKYQAAGNDFVALDDRAGILPAEPILQNLVRALCDRRRGVGSDGMLIIRPPQRPGADFTMVYYNADGSRGEMCGNGARSIARFAALVGAAGEQMRFDTDAGPYRAQLVPDGTVLSFPPVPGLPVARPVELLGRRWDVDVLRVGPPHVVVWVDDLATLDVVTAGRALRHHAAFAPEGANINFACPEPGDPTGLRVRTYERGVEDETLACGTGSTSTAICRARRLGLTGAQRFRVVPTGGDTLTIAFRLTDTGTEDITLAGPARLVYVARVCWDPATGSLTPPEGAIQ
jgi:diaminopimelate epimerase